MIYWPGFDFTYRLDLSGLQPHIAAVEACRRAASIRLCPPQWRESAIPIEVEAAIREAATHPYGVNEIQVRKQQLMLGNTSQTHAWVRKRFVPDSSPISLEDILEMHRRVAGETGIRYNSAGKLRQDGLKVVVGTEGIGYHVGAPAIKLPGLMNRYLSLVNGDQLNALPAAIHSLVAHFFFTTIHPFDDGNGRVSRLVAAGILFHRGYNGHGFYALCNYFYQNEERYHRILFDTLQDPHFDLTRFVAFGMEGLALELRGINSFIKMKLNRSVERTVLTPALRNKLQHSVSRFPA